MVPAKNILTPVYTSLKHIFAIVLDVHKMNISSFFKRVLNLHDFLSKRIRHLSGDEMLNHMNINEGQKKPRETFKLINIKGNDKAIARKRDKQTNKCKKDST